MSNKSSNVRTPLGRVLGLGSARSGTEHWWAQRLSAVALLPLGLWFAVSLLGLGSLDYYTVQSWLANPLNAVLVLLLVLALTYHSSLGTQVVAEDYVHGSAVRVLTLGLLRLLHVALAVAGFFAVLTVAVGAGA
jgi:succinate dehydrogenase / fumarate reductase, membrane anchor subunit